MNDVRHQLCVLGGVFAHVGSDPEGSGPALLGGQGALCAVGAARLGADVELVGVVGDDDVGSRLRADLIAEGVCVEALLPRAGTPTPRRPVPLEGGDGAPEPAAGAHLTPKDVDLARGAIAGAQLLLVSQDVPQASLERAVGIARSADHPVVLRACLGETLADEWLVELDLWIGTPTEARAFLELEPDEDCSPGGLARRLAALGPRWVALWLGAAQGPGGGAVLFDGERVHSHPGLGDGSGDPVALDAFTAALCIARLEDLRPMAALRLAVAAAALGPGTPATAQNGAASSGGLAVGPSGGLSGGLSGGPSASFPDAARLPLRDWVERRIASPASLLPSDAPDGSPTAPRPI